MCMNNVNVVQLKKSRSTKNLVVLFTNSMATTFNEMELLYNVREQTQIENAVNELKIDYARKNKKNYEVAIDNKWYDGSYTDYFHQDNETFVPELQQYLSNYDASSKEITIYLNVATEERLLDRETNVLDSRIPISSKYPDIDVVTINDPYDAWFLNAIQGVGNTFKKTSDYLKNLISNYTRVLFIGDRKNAYASLIYGSDCRVNGVIATHAETELSFRVNNLYNTENPFVVLQPYLSAKPFVTDSTVYSIHPLTHSEGKMMKPDYYFDYIKYDKCCRRINMTRLTIPHEGFELDDAQKLKNTDFLESEINRFF